MYPIEVISPFIKLLISLLMIIFFWVVVFRADITEADTLKIVSYFLLSGGVAVLTMSKLEIGLAKKLADSIKNGKFSNALIRPVSVISYVLAEELGENLLNYLFALALIAVGIIINPPVSFLGFIFFAAFITVSLLISLSFSLFIGSLALRVTETTYIRLSLAHIINLLSGAMLPLYLFPNEVGQVINKLPFAYMVYFPVISLQFTEANFESLSSLFIAVSWAVALFFVFYSLWLNNMKRYDSIGI